jgi:hypothetical protein
MIPIEDVKELDTLLMELDYDDESVNILLSTDSERELIELLIELDNVNILVSTEPDKLLIDADKEPDKVFIDELNELES